MSEALRAELQRQLAALDAQATAGTPIPAFNGFANMPRAPEPAPTPSPALAQNNLQALIDQAVDRKLATLQQSVQQSVQQQGDITALALRKLLADSITGAEMAWVEQHIKEGAPGFVQYLQSDSVKSGVRMLFDDYKAFLAGEKK